MKKKVIKIGIDVRFISYENRGIGVYCSNIIEYIKVLDKNNFSFILYFSKKEKEVLYRNVTNNHNIKTVCFNTKFLYLIFEQLYLPFRAIKDNLDYLHCTGNSAPFVLFGKTKLILTIHDVSYLKKREIIPSPKSMYQKFGRIYRKLIVRYVARKASYILTVSNFAKTDILDSIELNANQNIQVIYNSIKLNSLIKENDLYHRYYCNNYYTIISGVDPQKNLHWAITEFEQYLIYGGKKKLLIIGCSEEQFFQGCQKKEINSKIVFYGYKSNSQVREIIDMSFALIFPSLYESFGIPIIEAYSIGIPAIVSNRGAALEITGDTCLTFDPYESNILCKNMFKLENDVEFYVYESTRVLDRVKMFSDSEAQQKVVNFFNHLL